MAKKILDVDDGYAFWKLAPDEFLVAVDTSYDSDFGQGAVSNATSITVYTCHQPYQVADTACTWYPVYYDEGVASAVVVTNSAGLGNVYAPFPGVGKVIGPMRVKFELDSTWVGSYASMGSPQYIQIFTNTK